MEATDTTSPLEEACRCVGGPTRLASLLSERTGKRVSKASVSRWKKDGIPAQFCPEIEVLTGVKCERLHPGVNWAVLRNESSPTPSTT